MKNRCAHGFQHWLDALKVRIGCSHHEQTLTTVGVFCQAPDRRIHHAQAMRDGQFVESVRGKRVDRAHVHQQGALFGIGKHAIGAETDLLDLDRAGQHGDDDRACAGDLCHGGGCFGACRHKRIDRLRVDVEHDELKAFFLHVRGHGAPHAPQTDESDFFSHVCVSLE